MTVATDSITIEDLAGLEALPTGTQFRSAAGGAALVRTNTGVRRVNPLVITTSVPEWTTAYIARDILPAEIVNPETLGSFVGVGDRVKIVREYSEPGRGEFDGQLGEVVAIDEPGFVVWPFEVRVDNGPCVTVMKVELTDIPKPAPEPESAGFSIGDQVRVVREYPSSSGHWDGAVGTLLAITHPDETFPYQVQFDGFAEDVVHEIELVHSNETVLEYPLVHDEEGFDALPDGAILVPLNKYFSPVRKDGRRWRCFVEGSFELTDQTRQTVIDDGALVVYRP